MDTLGKAFSQGKSTESIECRNYAGGSVKEETAEPDAVHN